MSHYGAICVIKSPIEFETPTEADKKWYESAEKSLIKDLKKYTIDNLYNTRLSIALQLLRENNHWIYNPVAGAIDKVMGKYSCDYIDDEVIEYEQDDDFISDYNSNALIVITPDGRKYPVYPIYSPNDVNNTIYIDRTRFKVCQYPDKKKKDPYTGFYLVEYVNNYIYKDRLQNNKLKIRPSRFKRSRKSKKYKVIYEPISKHFTKDEFAERIGAEKIPEEYGGGYGNHFNEYAMYDSYSIGGRWANQFLVKNNVLDLYDHSNMWESTTEKYPYEIPEGYKPVSVAKYKDIEWDVMAKAKMDFIKKKSKDNDDKELTKNDLLEYDYVFYEDRLGSYGALFYDSLNDEDVLAFIDLHL